MYPIASEVSLSLDVILLHQVERRLNELKDLSQVHEPTGRARSSESILYYIRIYIALIDQSDCFILGALFN